MNYWNGKPMPKKNPLELAQYWMEQEEERTAERDEARTWARRMKAERDNETKWAGEYFQAWERARAEIARLEAIVTAQEKLLDMMRVERESGRDDYCEDG